MHTALCTTTWWTRANCGRGKLAARMLWGTRERAGRANSARPGVRMMSSAEPARARILPPRRGYRRSEVSARRRQDLDTTEEAIRVIRASPTSSCADCEVGPVCHAPPPPRNRLPFVRHESRHRLPLGTTRSIMALPRAARQDTGRHDFPRARSLCGDHRLPRGSAADRDSGAARSRRRRHDAAGAGDRRCPPSAPDDTIERARH